MCVDPATMLALQGGASALTSVLQFSADRKAAKANNNAVQAQLDNQMQTLEQQAKQTAIASRQKQGALVEQLNRDMGTLNTAVGESNVIGNSVDRLNQVAAINADRGIQSIQDNTVVDYTNIAASRNQAYQQAANSMKAKPSVLNLALSLAGTGVDYQTSMNQLNAAQQPKQQGRQ